MNADLRKRIPTGILYVIGLSGASLMNSTTSMVMLWILLGLCTYEFISIEFKSGGVTQQALNTVLVHLVVVLGVVLTFSDQEMSILSTILCILYLITGAMLWLQHKSLLTLLPKFLKPLFYLALPFMIGLHEVYQHEMFRLLILGSFIIIWLNDAGAYFVGKAIGKKKILYAVSPGKSWEGWIGGIIAGIIGAVIIAEFISSLTTLQWIYLALILGIVGLLGDLTESNWKRFHKIKDSSSILPGHGGFLDRLDSFIYSLPFISLFYHFIIIQ
ncbi:MAG: phosphatidate cytidylyltransferase [Saprospiraceae bacterium]|jgi:phosphatidate cytidylyltransferase